MGLDRAEAQLMQTLAVDANYALEVVEWVRSTACLLARLEHVAMPLSYREWRALIGFEPGAFDWEGEQVLRAAFYAAQPGCCA